MENIILLVLSTFSVSRFFGIRNRGRIENTGDSTWLGTHVRLRVAATSGKEPEAGGKNRKPGEGTEGTGSRGKGKSAGAANSGREDYEDGHELLAVLL